jgi:hypothetical protein
MKRWSVPLTLMIVMICLMAGSLHSAPEQDTPEVNVQELLKRVKQLEKRVAQLEKVRPGVAFPQTPQVLLQLPGKKITVVPGQPAKPQIPNDWKRNQINGIEYYLVPLDAKKK